MNKRYTCLVTSIWASLLSACWGGGGISDNNNPTTVSGKVADGGTDLAVQQRNLLNHQ